ncbi:MAG: glucosaminidase domain-containing protein [Bacillota bacterium]|nr:glucosaminidase domain-containing protein [Bacillota bacterium]MDW7685269.1 glucosaminidase domain-containing protein [Bacillota bacterium]
MKKSLLVSIILACLFILLTQNAYAAIDAYVIEDQNETYKYLMSDLVQSFNTDELIWNDFNERMMQSGVMGVYDIEKNRYVRFSALVSAFNEGEDVIAYTDRPDAVTVEVPEGIKLASLENNEVTFTAWVVPGVSSGLAAINTITDKAEMLTALTENAAELGLNLENFNLLNTYGKNLVAAEVISNRPDTGYATGDALITVFDGAWGNAAAKLSAAVKEINDAFSVAAMTTALGKNAEPLELDITPLDNLHVFARENAAKAVVAGRSYSSADAVKTAYNAALDETDATIRIKYTDYGYTLPKMTSIQMGYNPQTDLYDGVWRTADTNLVEWHVNPGNFVEDMLTATIISYDSVNLREGPSTEFPKAGLLNQGDGPFFVINQAVDEQGYTWYRLITNTRTGWVREDLLQLTERKGEGIFQFLVLSGTAGVPAEEINEKILAGKGILEGMGEAFVEGSTQHNINEIFLIALALHETGNGTSILAQGYGYNGETVYNMFGIGAVDADPINKGAEYAYNEGWFTPEAAIIGGAKFTSGNYINNAMYRQDTLYKMRWNPASPGRHQYATDIGWASKQIRRIKELYDLCNTYILQFDIPRYQK